VEEAQEGVATGRGTGRARGRRDEGACLSGKEPCLKYLKGIWLLGCSNNCLKYRDNGRGG
jgi:hypothetical protein